MHKPGRAIASLTMATAIAGFIVANKGNIQDCVVNTMTYTLEIMNATAMETEYKFPAPTSKGDRIAQHMCKKFINGSEDPEKFEAQYDELMNEMQNADSYEDMQTSLDDYLKEL